MSCFEATTIVAAPFSVADAEELKDAAIEEFVKETGGEVTRDENVAGKPIIGVWLYGPEVTDEELRELAKVESLTKLTLSSCHRHASGQIVLRNDPCDRNSRNGNGTGKNGLVSHGDERDEPGVLQLPTYLNPIASSESVPSLEASGE